MYVIVVYYVLHAHCHVQIKTTYLLTCLLTSYLYLYNMDSLPKNLKQVYDTRELRRRPKLTGAPFVYYLVGRATAEPPMSAQSFTFRSRLKTELFKLSWFCSCATTRLISPVHHRLQLYHHAVSWAWPSRVLTWHRNETRNLAITDLILYSAGV